jgi:hypothetical protein
MPQYNQPSDTSIVMKGSAGGPNNNNIRIYSKIFTLSGSSGSGYSLDITEAGFTGVTSVQMNPINNTNVLANIPIISEKSRSVTAIVVNILTVNSTQVTALLQTVTGLAFATNLTGISIDLRVEGF